jgi:hypothetical protein
MDFESIASVTLGVTTVVGTIAAFSKLGEIVGEWGDDLANNPSPSLSRKFRALCGLWGTLGLLVGGAIVLVVESDGAAYSWGALFISLFAAALVARLLFLIKEHGAMTTVTWSLLLKG